MSRKIKITSINESSSCLSDTDDSDIILVRKNKKQRIFSSSESDSDFSMHDDSCTFVLERKFMV
ncbi:hypothetical protein WN55_05528 [Dufourea novaeangliae]|uniref:Uncharacterized protein n=1 Tax=Dufourea novaeangliae TaxID=178035 RepID=A0A154PMT5_DUFNO|nr:hypothetical protein WN55_05528 [Dufourea novaeangliae]